MSDPNPGRKADAWRRHVGDMQALLHALATWLDALQEDGRAPTLGDGAMTGAAIARRAAHLLNSADGNARAEERNAWDQFAAAMLASVFPVSVASTSVPGAAAAADLMLEERRKRFAKKETP